MAVGTGFGVLFCGIGQVVGAVISIFQSRLDTELRKRIHTPDAEEVPAAQQFCVPCSDQISQLILEIRCSNAFVYTLMPEQQRDARDSYAIALKNGLYFCRLLDVPCVLRAPPDLQPGS
ncbi:hypothetical protein B0H19DRAFT_1068944 [Mycena capillaripes]|nr:hypothetical protein B0H19DRAFT_1068944 [Mycena capillaripes]